MYVIEKIVKIENGFKPKYYYDMSYIKYVILIIYPSYLSKIIFYIQSPIGNVTN